MTVIENIHPHIQYTYREGQQLYPIPFQYLEREYVKVKVRNQLLTYNVHYTVPLFNEEAFAANNIEPITDENIENVIANQLNVELLISPEEDLGDGITIADGDSITIFRLTPLDQQQEFPQNSRFSSQKITEALDKLTYQQQEQTAGIFEAQQIANQAMDLANDVAEEVRQSLPKILPFIYVQNEASDTWVINHNLNKAYPTIVLVDSAGTVMYPPVEYVNKNTCILHLIGEMAGTASVE